MKSDKSTKPVHVFERSLDTTKHCFIKALLQTKAIKEVEKTILSQFATFLKQYTELPDLIIYIRTSPSTVYERIKQRGRSEERKVDQNYLTLLHSLHEKWILKQKKGLVFIIDGNLKFEELEIEYLNCIAAIEQAIFNRELTLMQEQFSCIDIAEN